MNTNILKSVALAVGLSSSAFGQTTSQVVGYETLTLTANQFNLVGLRLHGRVVQSGTLTGVSGQSLQDSAADFASLTDPSYVVEITGGAGAGFLSLASISGTTITTDTDVSSGGMAAGDTYRIRRASTLQELFLDGGTLTSGSSESASDVVWVPNGSGGYTRYFYQDPLFGANRWFNASSGLVVTAAVPLSPTAGFFVEKRGNTSDMVVAGSLKTDASVFLTALSGFTPVSSVFPIGATLQNSGLSEVLTSASSEAASDVVLIPSATGGFTRYFYQNPLFGADRWFNATANSVVTADVDLSPGFFIQSRDSGTSFLQFNSDATIYPSL